MNAPNENMRECFWLYVVNNALRNGLREGFACAYGSSTYGRQLCEENVALRH